MQTVGLRFASLSVPRGATVTRAWIQFSTDEVSTDAATLAIAAQSSDNAATFTTGGGTYEKSGTAAPTLHVEYVMP